VLPTVGDECSELSKTEAARFDAEGGEFLLDLLLPLVVRGARVGLLNTRRGGGDQVRRSGATIPTFFPEPRDPWLS
jgi:hypothetical protein